MKHLTVGIFATREDAEKAIGRVHTDLNIPTDEISYVYRNTEGEMEDVDADEVAAGTPGEGAKKGAAVGGTVGAIAGIATAVGSIPVIGPIFAAGPLAAALGLTGALGTTAAGAITGAAAGGLVGALVNWGVGETKAKEYEDKVEAGSVLVAVHADDGVDVTRIFSDEGAEDVEVYEPNV